MLFEASETMIIAENGLDVPPMQVLERYGVAFAKYYEGKTEMVLKKLSRW